MQYRTYKFISESITSDIRKQLGIRKPKNAQEYNTLLKTAIEHLPQSWFKGMWPVQFAKEVHWKFSTENEAIVLSNEDIEALYRSKFELSGAIIEFPFTSFLLMLPKECRLLPGVDGALVTYDKISNNVDLYNSVWGNRVEMPEDADHQVDRSVLHIFYPDLNQDVTGPTPYAQFRVQESRLKEVLESPPGEDFTQGGNVVPASGSRERNRVLLRVITALAVYCQAAGKDALTEGFPVPQRIHDGSGRWLKNAKCRSLGHSNIEEREQAAHYRSWHFRVLTDERYYQGEWSDKAIGSRIVFVKDTMVKQTVKPYRLNS